MSDLRLDPDSLGSRVARIGLKMLRGWRIEGTLPTEPRAVVLAVPHTSNLDGLLLVLLTRSIGMRASWMVKDLWVKPPFGWVTKRVGAVPVDRTKANGMVGQMADVFATTDQFVLLIPPEGTRSLTEHWKSGFYRIATAAGVPVIPSYIDYGTRRGGFGAPIVMTGDPSVDMAAIRAFYDERAPQPRVQEKFGPMRLSDEN